MLQSATRQKSHPCCFQGYLCSNNKTFMIILSHRWKDASTIQLSNSLSVTPASLLFLNISPYQGFTLRKGWNPVLEVCTPQSLLAETRDANPVYAAFGTCSILQMSFKALLLCHMPSCMSSRMSSASVTISECRVFSLTTVELITSAGVV